VPKKKPKEKKDHSPGWSLPEKKKESGIARKEKGSVHETTGESRSTSKGFLRIMRKRCKGIWRTHKTARKVALIEVGGGHRGGAQRKEWHSQKEGDLKSKHRSRSLKEKSAQGGNKLGKR